MSKPLIGLKAQSSPITQSPMSFESTGSNADEYVFQGRPWHWLCEARLTPITTVQPNQTTRSLLNSSEKPAKTPPGVAFPLVPRKVLLARDLYYLRVLA